ncbi:MAG: hypothetical protein N3A68_09510 [Bacteroidia bacterium]|nr:hypothetical protein [Bacteroidia bacterium]
MWKVSMSKQPKIKEVKEELYVLYYEDKPLHLVKTGFFDWTPTKKVYWSVGDAKRGITNLPNFIDKEKVKIVPYVPKEE